MIHKKKKSCVKKMISLVLALVMVFSFNISSLAATPAAADTSWYNTTDASFVLSDASDLLGFAQIVNGTATDIQGTAIAADSFSGKTVSLANDIDLSTVCGADVDDWTAIGTDSHRFAGTFDGNGHRILNMYINNTTDYQGLFGVLTGGATIQNVVIDDSCSVIGAGYVAGLVGAARGDGAVSILNCGNEADVTGSRNAAGVIGCVVDKTIALKLKNCYNTGAIGGTSENGAISGWLGYGAYIENCYNIGSVSGTQAEKYFARYGSAVFSNCYQLDTLEAQANILTFTDADMKSGKLTAALGDGYGQVLGTNNYPVLKTANNSLYTVYKVGTCNVIEGYTNDASNANVVATHDASYENLGKCSLCGTPLPGSIFETGLDLTNANANDSGLGWEWNATSKELTLTDFYLSTDVEFAIKLPDGATIILSGDSQVISSSLISKTIWSEGNLTIKGNEGNSLNIVAGGGNVIYCENAGEDVALTIDGANITSSGGKILLPGTNRNASVTIEDSTIDTNLSRIEVYTGTDSTALSFIVKNSSITSDKLHVVDNTISDADSFVFQIDNSRIDATQTNGSAIEAAIELTGRNMDLDVYNSYVKAWTKGYTYSGNSYALRINAKGDTDVNFSESDFLLYGASTGLYIDATGVIKTGSAITDCTVISYAKQNTGNVHVWDKDTDSNNYANVDRSDIISDSILFEYTYMSGENGKQPSGIATVVGSPEVSYDFTLPETLGVSELGQYTDKLTLASGQSITIVDGVTMTMPANIPVELAVGASVTGEFVGTLVAADGAELITYDYGDYISGEAIASGTKATKPETPVGETACHKFLGWYADEAFTIPYEFDKAVTSDTVIYAKWEDSHAWGDWTKLDETQHIRVCEDDETHTEVDNHSGGTATADRKAVCVTCGAEYGEKLAPTPGSSDTNDSEQGTTNPEQNTNNQNSGQNADTQNSGQSATSPKTGDVDSMIPLMTICIVGAALAAVFRMRKSVAR